VRLFLALTAVLLAACASAPAPAPVEKPKPDPAKEVWYGPATEELAALNRDAEDLLRRGKSDEAAALITKGQPMMSRLLTAPRPTLAAMEAASDLDDLYGRMLLSNRNYGWARLQFQKNVSRWKGWTPPTQETERRRKQAESKLAECDRALAQ
jgi:hypothetical protein